MNNLYWPVYKNLEKEVLELSYNIYFDDAQFEYMNDNDGKTIKIPPYSLKTGDLLMRCCTEIESLIVEMTQGHDQEIRESSTNQRPIKKDEGIPIGCRGKWIVQYLDLDKKVVQISCANMFFIESKNRFFAPFNYSREDNDDFISAYNAIKHNRNKKTIPQGNIRFLLRSLAALYLLNIYYRDEETIFETIWDKPLDLSLGSEIFSLRIHDVSNNFAMDLVSKTGADYPSSVFIRKLRNDDFIKEAEEDFVKNKDRYQKYKEILSNAVELKDFFSKGGKIFGTREETIALAAGTYFSDKVNELKTFKERAAFVSEMPLFRARKGEVLSVFKRYFPDQDIDFADERITSKNLVQVCTVIGALGFTECFKFKLYWQGTDQMKQYEKEGGKYDIENIHLAQLEIGESLITEMNKLSTLDEKIHFIEQRPVYRHFKDHISQLLNLMGANSDDKISEENVELLCGAIGYVEQTQKISKEISWRNKEQLNQPRFLKRTVTILNKGQPLYSDISLPADSL